MTTFVPGQQVVPAGPQGVFGPSALPARLRGPWASRPPAAGFPGSRFEATDLPAGGSSLWRSDGAFWHPEQPLVLLSAGNLGLNIDGATLGTGDNTAFSLMVPGGTLRENGTLRVQASFAMNPTAGNRTFRLFFGGTLLWQSIGYGGNDQVAFDLTLHAANSGSVVSASPTFTAGQGAPGFSTLWPPAFSGSLASDRLLLFTAAVPTTGDITTVRSVQVVLL